MTGDNSYVRRFGKSQQQCSRLQRMGSRGAKDNQKPFIQSYPVKHVRGPSMLYSILPSPGLILSIPKTQNP